MSHQLPRQLVCEQLCHRRSAFFRLAHPPHIPHPFDPPIGQEIGGSGDRRRSLCSEAAGAFPRCSRESLAMDKKVASLLESIVGRYEGAGSLGGFNHDHSAGKPGKDTIALREMDIR